MTVAALKSAKNYMENGVTLSFAVPFRFLPGTIVASRVLADGTVVPLVSGTDFTTTGGETDDGGTLTLISTVAGAILRIRRSTSRVQAAAYTVSDAFPAKSHEGALDRAMLIDQEQDDQIADTAARALLVPDGETAPGLPVASLRANRFPQFSSDGKTIVMASGTGTDAALRTDLADAATNGLGAALIRYKQAGAGAAARTALDKLRERISVKDFGATGLGVLSEVAAFAAAEARAPRLPPARRSPAHRARGTAEARRASSFRTPP